MPNSIEDYEFFLKTSTNRRNSFLFREGNTVRFSSRNTDKASNLAACSVNANHAVPADRLKTHELKCLCQHWGISERLSKTCGLLPITEPVGENVILDNQTIGNLLQNPGFYDKTAVSPALQQKCFTPHERLTLYEFVKSQVPTSCPSDISEFPSLETNLHETERNRKRKRSSHFFDHQAKDELDLEMKALYRDMKRRRQSYRGVHTAKKSYKEPALTSTSTDTDDKWDYTYSNLSVPNRYTGIMKHPGGNADEYSTLPDIKYEYLDHTADVQLHAWGDDLTEAFEQVCMAMFGYMTDMRYVEMKESQIIEATGDDIQSLLFHFLDEWLFLFSAEPFFIPRKVKILEFDADNFKIKSIGYGEEFDIAKHPQEAEVKAITYSAMQIYDQNDCHEVFVIVDI